MEPQIRKRHVTIMKQEVYDAIPSTAQVIVDGTLGHGGHMDYIINKDKENDKQRIYIGNELDPAVLIQAREYLAPYEDTVAYLANSYTELSS